MDHPSNTDHQKNPLKWSDNGPELSPAARQLLEDYAKIPASDIDAEVSSIRDKAFAVHPYPCIGHFRFLDLGLHSWPIHNEVVSRIKKGQKYLDLGCCFGQETRYLVSQGCPSENLYGADLRPDFVDFGYQLFRDRDTIKSKFLAPADIFAEEPLSELDGKIDIVNASSFFHLFSWEDSLKVAKRIIGFLKPVEGSLVIGRQVGSANSPGPKDTTPGAAYRHNEESWKRFWKEVGDATDTDWDVDFRWDDTRSFAKLEANNPDRGKIQRFCFVLRRL